MPGADRLASLPLAALLALAIPMAARAAESETGYVWTGGETEKGFSTLVYGSPETPEDLLFWVHCDMKKKTTEMTVYVDNPGTKVGQAITIELSAGAAKLPVKGTIATDEMSGFLFAEARNFKVKPVIELLKPKGEASAKTGNVVTTLPDDGRAEAVSEFAKACKLD
jgi:HSP20 family molecular chaperone IbpA